MSAKVSGETASLTNPALDRVLDFAAESGLVVILHNDIDMPFAKTDAEPVYLTQTKDVLRRHRNASIIWAHTGLGRIVHPVQVSAETAERDPNYIGVVEAMLMDPTLAHVNFDISWDEVAKYAVASPQATRAGRDGAQSVSRSVSVRDRHRRAGQRGAVLRRVRHVGTGVAAADAGREPESAEGQLRADLQRGTQARPRVGTTEREIAAGISTRSHRCF